METNPTNDSISRWPPPKQHLYWRRWRRWPTLIHPIPTHSLPPRLPQPPKRNVKKKKAFWDPRLQKPKKKVQVAFSEKKMKKTKQNFQFDDKILISIVAFKRQQKCIFYVAFPPLEKNIGMDISSHVPVIFYHVYVQRLNWQKCQCSKSNQDQKII